MKLKEILDMETYLKERCYCPGEIYSSDGFFFQIFDANEECKMLGEVKNDKYNFIAVISKSTSENADPSILALWRNDECNEITDSTRFDATENNIKLIKEFINGRTNPGKFDEFEEGATQKSLQEIFGMVDAIMI